MEALIVALSNRFGVVPPTVVIHPEEEVRFTPCGKPVWGYSHRGEIHLWKPKLRLLAHEFGHYLQDEYEKAWPISPVYLVYRNFMVPSCPRGADRQL